MTAQKSLHWKAFLLALGISTAVFLPFVIYNGGYFIFIGDFNAQQIPFYKLVHQAVREGNFGWSWTTDLGANFIASYSFYNLTSPFFWLTIPFPTDWVPFLMAPLLILKNACAVLFLHRHSKNTATSCIVFLFSPACIIARHFPCKPKSLHPSLI